MSMKEKMQRMNQSPVPMHKQSTLVHFPLNKKTLPEEIKQLIDQELVDSVT